MLLNLFIICVLYKHLTSPILHFSNLISILSLRFPSPHLFTSFFLPLFSPHFSLFLSFLYSSPLPSVVPSFSLLALSPLPSSSYFAHFLLSVFIFSLVPFLPSFPSLLFSLVSSSSFFSQNFLLPSPPLMSPSLISHVVIFLTFLLPLFSPRFLVHSPLLFFPPVPLFLSPLSSVSFFVNSLRGNCFQQAFLSVRHAALSHVMTLWELVIGGLWTAAQWRRDPV